jgi:hypothetical protein
MSYIKYAYPTNNYFNLPEVQESQSGKENNGDPISVFISGSNKVNESFLVALLEDEDNVRYSKKEIDKIADQLQKATSDARSSIRDAFIKGQIADFKQQYQKSPKFGDVLFDLLITMVCLFILPSFGTWVSKAVVTYSKTDSFNKFLIKYYIHNYAETASKILGRTLLSINGSISENKDTFLKNVKAADTLSVDEFDYFSNIVVNSIDEYLKEISIYATPNSKFLPTTNQLLLLAYFQTWTYSDYLDFVNSYMQKYQEQVKPIGSSGFLAWVYIKSNYILALMHQPSGDLYSSRQIKLFISKDMKNLCFLKNDLVKYKIIEIPKMDLIKLPAGGKVPENIVYKTD